MERPEGDAMSQSCDLPISKSVAAIDKAALRHNLADFVCFSCGTVIDSTSESEVTHWLSRGRGLVHSLVMNVTSFTIRDLLARKSIPNAEAVMRPPLRDAIEHLHTVRYGHLDWLYPERRAARDQRLRDAHLSAKRAAASFDLRWQAFKDRFDSSMAALVSSIAWSMLADGGAPWTEPAADDKAAVFQGRPPTVLAIAEGIRERRFRRIVAIIGAGVSTSAGIPDFRSANGFFQQPPCGGAALPGATEDAAAGTDGSSGAGGAASSAAGVPTPMPAGSPEKLFDLAEIKRNPAYFAAMAGKFVSHHLRVGGPAPGRGGARPTAGHAFLRLLSDRGQLLRCYTQNIDDLESAAGLPPHLVVQAHGSFASATCLEQGCEAAADASEVNASLVKGEVPRCGSCGGLVKPDVVAFGESLPRSYAPARRRDMEEADLVLIMGTSLKVQPVASQPRDAGSLVPRLLINRELVGADDATSGSAPGSDSDGKSAVRGAASRPSSSGLRCDGSEDVGMPRAVVKGVGLAATPSVGATERAGVAAATVRTAQGGSKVTPQGRSRLRRPAAASSAASGRASERPADHGRGSSPAPATAIAAASTACDRSNYRDAALLGDIDEGVRRIAAAMGLSSELEALIDELQGTP